MQTGWTWLRASSYQRPLLLSVGVGMALAAATVAAFSAFSSSNASIPSGPPLAADPPAAALPEADPAGASVPAEPSIVVVSEGAIVAGATLAASLRKHGVSAEVVELIASEMASVFDFRRAQPGHTYRLAQELDGSVVEFRYGTSPVESYLLVREGEGYVARREQAELVARSTRMAGVISTSLYGAVRDLGEDPQLAHDFADVFAWDVDFARAVHPGDEFRVLYERLYVTDDEGGDVYVRPGRILAAHYQGAAGGYTALYFESEKRRGGYYRPDGTSVQRQFLAAPLRYSRISSRYSSARRHPILNITRPHHGIDYAASMGAPIWAVADGKVIYKGRSGGFGNLVKIRHTNGYVSYYAHMSDFAKGLHVGQVVQQKQVIGYVGQSGLATGPHVCFRIAKNGRYVNPAQLRAPAGTPVRAEQLLDFRATRDVLLAELDTGLVVATDEAL